MLRSLLVTSHSKNYRCHTGDRCATLARSYALSVPPRGPVFGTIEAWACATTKLTDQGILNRVKKLPTTLEESTELREARSPTQ